MIMPTEKSKHTTRMGIFECPLCGGSFRANYYGVKSGKIKNCRCVFKGGHVTKSFRHGDHKARLYGILSNIKARCNNPNNPKYEYYGGRGIKVCDEWMNSYILFRDWAIYNGYSDSLEIDRIENDLGYSPSNCRWVTSSTNKENTRLLKSSNTSGIRGVIQIKSTGKWVSRIYHNKICYRLGHYNTKEEALLAYNNFVIKNKTFHPLNIIPKI